MFLIHLSQLSFKTCGQLLYSHMVKWSKSELLSNCPPAARLLCPWSRPQQVMRKAWEQAGRRMRHWEARAERNKDFQYITLTVKSEGKVTSGYERLYIFCSLICIHFSLAKCKWSQAALRAGAPSSACPQLQALPRGCICFLASGEAAKSHSL